MLRKGESARQESGEARPQAEPGYYGGGSGGGTRIVERQSSCRLIWVELAYINHAKQHGGVGT